MDACEIANFLASELFMHQFVASDTGYNGGLSVISGAPTRTTSTLTPTTLRNIEQTFQDLTNDLSQSAPYQAGFVPPPPAPMINQDQYVVPSYQQPQAIIPSFLTEEDANNSIESLDTSSMSDSSWHTPPPMIDELKGNNGKGRPRSNYSSNTGSTQANGKPRRNVGGRKPNKPSNLSPEEEEKRRVRRERNKQAAARCRRRREDHTQDLQKQVDEMEDRKRQLTAEIQQISKIRDELCELIEEHKKTTRCVIGDRESPADVKPNVNGKNDNNNIPVIFTTTSTMCTQQRPANFATSFSNNNNINTLNANSKLSLKIKAEPLDLYDDEPPSKKRCDMLSGQEYDITTPTTPYMPQLNTPTFIPNKQSPLNKPNRPSSLNVPANLKPSEALQRKNVTDLAGINVCTPSTGMFNFESLMEGGTGLTPVSNNPLVPCSTQNRNPLEMLHTPTSGSEPSKLVSL